MMTEHEMRVAIAEACGWEPRPGGYWHRRIPGRYGPEVRGGGILEDIPDYLNDLNAMHEAVRSQNNGFVIKHTNHLERIVERDRPHGEDDRIVHCLTSESTAKQRATAFCMTLFPERFKE